MTTKLKTTASHHLFLYACATGLWLCLSAAGPAHALDTTTATYGGVNFFKFDLYGLGDEPPDELKKDFEGSSWNLTTAMKADIRRSGDLWAEILGPGSALTTTPGGPLTLGIPFMVTTSYDEDNASAFSLPNENDTMTGVQRGLVDAITPDKPGAIEIGLLFDSETGLDFSQLSPNDAFIGSVFHELGHALGVFSLGPTHQMDDQGEAVVNQITAWDRHLYDKHGTRLDVGVTLTPRDPGEAGTGLFYVGQGINSEVTFRGDHVAEVLSDGRVTTASADYAFTVEGQEERFDLSHIELERSLMSHQNYRNYSIFLEAELAALQDIGYRIDRRNFYGFSVYADDSVFTYSDGYHDRDYDSASDTGTWTGDPNTATLGVGLHIYGKGNTVTVSQNAAGTGDVRAHGEAGAGVRVDGSGNTLIIGSDAGPLTVSADGKNGTGLLAAYGKNHVITIGADASVTARGVGGIGARFDFGHNLVGDHNEYRGSHIHWKGKLGGGRTQLPVTGEDDSGFALNLDGPLVRDFTVAGALTGGTAANGGAALFISDNARVGTITVKNGAAVTGDIISRWDAQNENIQYSGDRADLYATLTLEQGATFDGDIDGASGIDLVNLGFARSSDGRAVLNSAAVHDLDNRADLTVERTLTTDGLARISNSALTLREGAKADFQGGLDLRDGGALDLDGAQVSVGRGAAVVYDEGSALRVGAGLFQADAASFFTLNDDGAGVTLAAGADRLVTGKPGGALTLHLAQYGDVYTLAQWADARNKLGLGGADLAIFGTLSDEVVLSMRADDAQARFTAFDAPRAYGATGAPRVPYAPFNAVRLEDATGALLSPVTMTITDSEFVLSHWVTDADAVALTVGGDAELWISGAANGHGIFEWADGAFGAWTGLTLTDAAQVVLGGASSTGRVAMPLVGLNTATDTTLTLSGVNASASSVNASGTVKVQDSALAGDTLTLNGGALTLDMGEVHAWTFTVVNGGTVTANYGVLSATGSFVVTPAASFPLAWDAEAHVVSGENLAVRGVFALSENGVMTVESGIFTADALDVSGKTSGRPESFLVSFNDVDAAVGRLSLDLDAGYGAMVFNRSHAALGSIELGTGVLNVSNSRATADALAVGGGTLKLATSLFAAKTVTGDINGSLQLQFGALAALGMDVDSATKAARAGGMIVPFDDNFGKRVVALVLGAPVTLGPQGTLGLLVPEEPSGDAPDFDPNIYFGNSSLLVVDAAALNGGAAITAASPESAAMIANSAALRVLGATVKGVDILDNFGGGLSLDGWTEITTPDRMLSLNARLADTDTVSVFADILDPLLVFPGLGKGMSATMREVWGLGKNNVNSPYGGIRLLSRAARDDYMADTRDAVRTMESVTHAVLAAGVPDMTFTVNSAASSVAGDRMSLVQSGRESAESADAPFYGKTGIALWAIPLFQDWKSRDLEAGVFEMDLDGSLGGLSLGADYTFEAAVRAGLAFHVGNGRMRSKGDFNDTENDSRFWGLGAYAGWAPGAFSLSADAHYTRTDNKVQQALPFDLGMGDLRGDIHASAVSAGLRGEYVFATQWLDITPHLGVRYTRLHTAQHDLGSAGLSVLEGESIKQDIWSFPVGLTFSRDFQHGEAWLRPLLDLTIIPYAGDTEAWSVARFSGVDAAVGMSTRVLDSVTYGGQIGLEAGNSKVNLGVHYGLQMGEHSTRHGVFATFRYGF